jgi:pimeloyl-ACP methyl ester carboxylesterase
MYYEVHGSGGTPLLLLHGGLFNIDLQFGALLPSLAASRKVIAADFQGHGRTNDIDRPLTCADLASDVVGLLQHLGVAQADVFGFSVGGGVALHLAIRHAELVRKLIVSSVSFHPDGDRSEDQDAVGEMTVDMIVGRATSKCATPPAPAGRPGGHRRLSRPEHLRQRLPLRHPDGRAAGALSPRDRDTRADRGNGKRLVLRPRPSAAGVRTTVVVACGPDHLRPAALG